MSNSYFKHPNRFPGNADGPFYTTGHGSVGETKFNGMMADCLQCEAPEHEAPDLLAELNDDNMNTYFVRQPSTPDEICRACNALRVCCVWALRYGGRDREIIRLLGNTPECCDYIIDDSDQLRLTVGENGELLQFANSIVNLWFEIGNENTKTVDNNAMHAKPGLRAGFSACKVIVRAR